MNKMEQAVCPKCSMPYYHSCSGFYWFACCNLYVAWDSKQLTFNKPKMGADEIQKTKKL